ncbi:MAG TPA: ABC transporter ATP-binding protein [Bacillota bacterium]
MASGEKVVEVIDLASAFEDDGLPELAGVNLQINAGEIVSLVGPSGCGKSTLLRLIAGVLRPIAGEIKVFGENKIPGWTRLSLVPQDALLLPWRTVLDNVRLPLELSAGKKKDTYLKAREALALANLTGVEDKYPHQLSGGMKQRAALARALVGQARLLLLDEPFAALDAITRSQLHLELLRIWERTGITVLLVTHNIFEAVFLSHRVLVMREKPGRVIGEIRVDLGFPRTLKLVGTTEFSRLVGQVQELLEEGWGEEACREEQGVKVL